jgi:hypothetical protein
MPAEGPIPSQASKPEGTVRLDQIVSAAGAGAKVLTTASSAAVLFGAVYLADCRVSAKGAEAVDRCYFTAMPLMGLGVGARGAFSLGFNTYNPALRKEEEHGAGRDEHGRFVKRDRG